MVLAPAGSKTLLKKLATAQGLRGELGGLADWMEGEEAFGAVTTKGLGLFFSLLRRGGLGGQEAGAVDEGVLAAERELGLLAFRGRLDENGNLSASLRARLDPNGAWMALGRDLRPTSGLGVAELPKAPFFMAGGGNLPSSWIRSFMEEGPFPLLSESSLSTLPEKELHAVREARRHQSDRIKGFSVLARDMGIFGPSGFTFRLKVDDVPGFEADTRALAQAVEAGFTARGMVVPLRFQSMELEGRHSFGLAPTGDAGNDESAFLAPKGVSYLVLDGETLAFSPGGPESLQGLAAPAEGHLDEDEQLREVGDRLPKDGSFYAFLDPSGPDQVTAHALRKMEEALPEDLRTGLPPIPEIPHSLPVGLSVRFDLDEWELSLAFPVEAQLVQSGHNRALEQALAARQAAYERFLARQRVEGGGAPLKPRPEGTPDGAEGK